MTCLSVCADFCLHFWCQPCAHAQELRFLKSLGRFDVPSSGKGQYQPVPSMYAYEAPGSVGTHATT